MKNKRLSLAIALLLAAGGLWLTRSAWRTPAVQESSTEAGIETPAGQPKAGQMPPSPNPGQMLRPPDQARKFMEFTPEQRVEFARKGHGPGG
ncbi:MAG TPA: hypothetical protein VMF06_12720 [Candidatus Limnocylindria bacterium]|jgi:hypothetical protein|nr:hypothetical protein [Candidatus Limnocylindria bacterium]